MIDNNRVQLIDNIRIAIAQATDETEILKHTVELIDAFSENFNWTGVYMMKDGQLEVGPYVGPKTEHTRIDLDAGICGAAASQKKSIIIADVAEDPRFLACSVSTRSEIVVPIMNGDIVLGEIDIDSNKLTNFDHQDQEMLEQIAALLSKRLKELA